MSLVTSLDFINDLVNSTSGSTNIDSGNDDSTISGINTIKYTVSSAAPNSGVDIPESIITYNLKASKLDDYIFSNTDIINLKFDIYLNKFNASNDIFSIKINDNVIFYYSGGGGSIYDKKFTINYLFKSSELNSILSNNNPTLKMIFNGIDAGAIDGHLDYVLLDRNFELYAIYKPEFSDTTNIPRTIQLNTSYNASSEVIANANACEIKGPSTSVNSGDVTFDISGKLLNGKPISLFFNLNIKSVDNNEVLKIQIYKDDGIGFVDYLELTNNDNDTLKTFFYSQTENYNSTNDFKIKFILKRNGAGNVIGTGDFVYFENMFTYIPEAINFFDASGINPSGTITLEPNLLINSNEYVGSIELFNSLPLPDNYLLCDGSEITKSDNDGNYYAPLIDLLNGDTSGNSCYLPNFLERHPLGVNSGVGISNYNSANSNHDGNNILNINHFPIHNHTADNTTILMNSYDILVNKTGNNDITFGGTPFNNPSYEAGNQGQNLGHQGDLYNHTHGVDVSAESSAITSINYNINLQLQNSNTQNTIPSGSNTPENRENYDLALKSYKLYFGIRFK